MNGVSSNPLQALIEKNWFPATKLLWDAKLISKENFLGNDSYDNTIFSGLFRANNSVEAIQFLLDVGCDPFLLSSAHRHNSLLPDIFGVWRKSDEKSVLTILKNTSDEILKIHHRKNNFFSYALRFSHLKIAEHLVERGALMWDSNDKTPEKNIDDVKTASGWQELMEKYGVGRPTNVLAADIVNYLDKKNGVNENAYRIERAISVLKENEAMWTPDDINCLLRAAAATKNKGTLSAFTKALKIDWSTYTPPSGQEHPFISAVEKERYVEILWMLGKGLPLNKIDQNGDPLITSMTALRVFPKRRSYHKEQRFDKTKEKIATHLRQFFLSYLTPVGDDTFYDVVVRSVSKTKNSLYEVDFNEWFTPSYLRSDALFWWEYLSDGKLRLENLLDIKKSEAVIFVSEKFVLGLNQYGWKKVRPVLMGILEVAANSENDESIKSVEKILLPALVTHADKIKWDGWSEDSRKNIRKLCESDASKLGQMLWKEVGTCHLLSLVDAEKLQKKSINRI